MPTPLTRTPPMGRSNWGTGVQPERGPRQLDMPAAPSSRDLGTLTQANARPFSRQLNPNYDESQDPVAPVAARPAAPVTPRTMLTRAPAPTAMPNTDGLTGFALSNTLNNAGIYQPGTFGASNAEANGTGFRPPQQTERADPLTGDQSNGLLQGQSAPIARPPFVQRGNGGALPGQNSQGGIMAGSGLFRRSFKSPKSAGDYANYVRTLFPDTGN